jgi:hypothetical protein
VLNLDQDRRVAGAAAIALNWSTLAQTKIGAPESDFANESLVRLHGVDDEIGLHAMNKNWPVIEALAQTLLQKGITPDLEKVFATSSAWSMVFTAMTECWPFFARVIAALRKT